MIIRRGKSDENRSKERSETRSTRGSARFFHSFYITWRTILPTLQRALSSKFIFNPNHSLSFCISFFFSPTSEEIKKKKMVYKSLDSITRSDIKALGISDDVSNKLLGDLEDIIRNHHGSSPPERWIEISRRILHPSLPFSFHQMMYYGCYKDFGPDPPAWLPDPYGLFPLLLLRF